MLLRVLSRAIFHLNIHITLQLGVYNCVVDGWHIIGESERAEVAAKQCYTVRISSKLNE